MTFCSIVQRCWWNFRYNFMKIQWILASHITPSIWMTLTKQIKVGYGKNFYYTTQEQIDTAGLLAGSFLTCLKIHFPNQITVIAVKVVSTSDLSQKRHHIQWYCVIFGTDPLVILVIHVVICYNTVWNTLWAIRVHPVLPDVHDSRIVDNSFDVINVFLKCSLLITIMSISANKNCEILWTSWQKRIKISWGTARKMSTWKDEFLHFMQLQE